MLAGFTKGSHTCGVHLNTWDVFKTWNRHSHKQTAGFFEHQFYYTYKLQHILIV